VNETQRLRFFLSVFLALHLAFIPLIASYGLAVCPVLRVAGFWLGCAYSGLFIVLVYALNAALILLGQSHVSLARKSWLYPLAYLVATLIALLTLQFSLNVSHAGSRSRAPDILLLTSLLLGLTQYYGMRWVRQSWNAGHRGSINQLWREHSLKVMVPIFAMAAVSVHFALSQKFLAKAIPRSVSEMANDGIVVTVFLVFWLFITYLFHFLAERDSALRISQQLKAVEASDFSQLEVVKTWGLWLFLSQRLRDLGQTMKERTYLVKSFSRFVAQDVVDRATQKEVTLVEGEGESVELTIVVTDIRGFTRISDDLPADKVVLMLNSYFNMVIDVFVRNGIHIDKFIGDGILAYVDPTGDPQRDNECAVRALQEILERLGPLNTQLASEGLPAVNIGGSIHRGTVIRGLIGSSQRLEHTIIGDPVNRAARLESLTKEYGVDLIMSSDVHQCISPSLQAQFQPLGRASVRGIDEGLLVFGYRQ
jgi:class 3 adenylate cyclase